MDLSHPDESVSDRTLHLSLLLRVGGHLGLVVSLQQWDGLPYTLAVLLFLINNIRAVKLGATVAAKIADDVTPADRQKALLRSFEEHEAKEIGKGLHEKYLKMVQELEGAVR
jgi:hypothetical protein